MQRVAGDQARRVVISAFVFTVASHRPTCPQWEATVLLRHREQEPNVTYLVETDSRSRAVIPGHANQRFLLQQNEDGSLLLQPARVITEAQAEYDQDPELRELLDRAARASTVRRSRQRRPA